MDSLDFSGQRVGPYHLTNILGVGSVGRVYRAVDMSCMHRKPFALKCLPKMLSPRHGIHLVRELLLHDAVTGCPHVLPLRDIIDEDVYVFLILDLCQSDLYKAIWEHKVYWRNDALIRRAFIEVLDGVRACHERKIYHRDLKPCNIMCNSDGVGIQIGDFGNATDERISRHGPCGTPYYMSPECWMGYIGDPYNSAQTDVWSLGIVLFNMVTSSFPWQVALSSDEEFNAFIDDEEHLFHTSPISEQLSDLLKWILHPSPKKRLSIPEIRDMVLGVDTFYKWNLPPSGTLEEKPRADSGRTYVRREHLVDHHNQTSALV